ncbi:hypothetical protein [Clostridium sp. DL1XJH146]
MYFELNNNKREFKYGGDNFEMAEKAAKECKFFSEDVEDEIIADSEFSCYNCIYRRWTSKSFSCMKKEGVK